MTTALRLLGLLLLLGGGVAALFSARRLPEALPSGTLPEIVDVTDFDEQLPRRPYVHVLGGWYLPYASLTLSAEGEDDGAFFLVPLVDDAHPLKREMERVAEGAYNGDAEAVQQWNTYATSTLDLTEVRVMVLSTRVPDWSRETAVAVETRWVEGVFRPADEALAPEILEILSSQFAGVVPGQLLILYEDEVPPREESVRMVLLLSGLAALLGLATLVATVAARRPAWLR